MLYPLQLFVMMDDSYLQTRESKITSQNKMLQALLKLRLFTGIF